MILIADDEPRIGEPLKAALSEAGFGVRYVKSPADALRSIESEGLLALITDVQLGSDVDGWAVARRARERQPELPIVYISGTCAADHRSRGVPDSLMLRKPFVPAQLLRALRELLDQGALAATAPR